MASKYIHLSGPVTGYSHPKCYANIDANCSDSISREHYISASYLRQVEHNGTVKIAGLAWQQPETFDLMSINSLQAKVLCGRHNSAISGMDSTFSIFADTIREIDRNGAQSSKAFTFSGNAIELWMLKTIIGSVASRNFGGTVAPIAVELLLGRKAWPRWWGLYFSPSSDQPIYHTDSLMIETLINPVEKNVMGCRFYIQGLPFTFLLGTPDNPEAFGFWRPREIDLDFPHTEQKIIFKWDGLRRGKPVRLQRAGAYDGPPPIWKDWEKS